MGFNSGFKGLKGYVPMPTGEMGVTNIAEVFRDIPKADCWIHMYLCSNSCSDNIIMHFFKNNINIFAL